jgi:lysophospholipase L1-like esterase
VRSRSWLLLIGGLLLLAAAVGVGTTLGRSDTTRAASSHHASCPILYAQYRAALRSPVTAGAPGLIVVIGDSYSLGHGLPAGRAGGFPALLARHTHRPVRLDGFGTTGFTTRGRCPNLRVTYGERLVKDRLLALHPATVIVEGGVNDARHGRPAQVGAAARALLRRLSGVRQVIVVGPADIPNANPARLATVNAGLAAAARSARRPYLNLFGHALPMQSDGIHPTEAGQRTIAALLVSLLRSASSSRS